MDKKYLKLNDIDAYKTAFNLSNLIRKLLSEEEYNQILGELQKLPKELNQLIKFTNQKLKI